MKPLLTRPSLVRRQLLLVVGALTVVAVLLGTGGALLIDRIVEQTADRLLGASARAIAETLSVEDGAITLDLPPSALGMLENTERDNIYYSVRQDGALLTGYPDLAPAPANTVQIEQSTFRYDRFRGARIRIAAEARRLPGVPGLIVVEVAETLQSRKDLARSMLVGLAALEAALVLIAALLIWPAVRWSLRPVTRLREQMDARSAGQAGFAELTLEHVPTELVGLVNGFNGLLRRLETSVEGMRRFTADASHQMRTPLAILRTHLAVLRKHQPESETGRASIADIALATDRLQSLLTGLITLARAEEIPPDEGRPVADLGALARQVAADHASAAAKGRVQVAVEAPAEPVTAAVEPFLVSELLSNLVDNAIRYNRRGGHVTIAVRPSSDATALVVEDDGPGVPHAERDRIFSRFYRMARDAQRPGSGLGLSIVQAIALKLGAELSVGEGIDGGGLSIVTRFPTG